MRIGLKRIHVEGMMRKGIIPPNSMVWLRVPFEYGGKAEFSNMLFMRRRPVENILSSFIDNQIKVMCKNGQMPEKLFLPNPEDKVLVTMFNGTIGGGGNTSADRLEEVASGINQAKAAAVKAAIAAKMGASKK